MPTILDIERFGREIRTAGLLPPLWYEDGALRLVDQTRLPHDWAVLTIRSVDELADAVRTLKIRGSGALGLSAAYGLLLSFLNDPALASLSRDAALLGATRPTALNLTGTLTHLLEQYGRRCADGTTDWFPADVSAVLARQLEIERAIGRHGAPLIADGANILTHCHSGALAGSGYGGRALAPLRTACEAGRRFHVYVSETRPYFQGARITAFELAKIGIPHTIITDGASGQLMQNGAIQAVVVGSDRVMRQGDLYNKVGTYMHALAAKANDVPFYAATAAHTVDLTADALPVATEIRGAAELTMLHGRSIAPDGSAALYLSFDRTPASYLTAFITEKGIIRPPFERHLKEAFG